MQIERPYNGRATLEDTIGGVIISIPSKKNILVTLFLLAWLCGWAFGEVTVITVLITGKAGVASPFLLFWLCAWTVGGLAAINTLLWLVVGKEILTFDRGILTIKKKGSILGSPKSFDISEIKNLKVDPNDPFSTFWGIQQRQSPFSPKGIISFNYGMKTITMAGGIDAPEAEYLFQLMVEKGILRSEQIA